jgi:hypothetical protein
VLALHIGRGLGRQGLAGGFEAVGGGFARAAQPPRRECPCNPDQASTSTGGISTVMMAA